eukprot:CAMPEP_0181352792 /NCGR_PEP_ID=MMETSP1106-20121128/2499_1 /TAXON_ID=81844 /ORGANISM="Mantoniella antarctica, Strain SL-175" /LENGTH=99 /DNA_ID=CAMNT_0023465377 /DNA_START=36 /DNA_END=336 /DNA_ORIENTATION=+
MWLTLDGDLSERSDDEGYILAPRNSSETDGDWRINAAELYRTMSGGPSPPGSQTGPALAKYAAIAKQHYAATTNQGRGDGGQKTETTVAAGRELRVGRL